MKPRCFALSSGARGLWIAFSNHVEQAITPNGTLEPVRGLANKLPEHAARLAAVLGWWTICMRPRSTPITCEQELPSPSTMRRKHCAFSVRAASTPIFGSRKGFSTGFRYLARGRYRTARYLPTAAERHWRQGDGDKAGHNPRRSWMVNANSGRCCGFGYAPT